MLKIKKAFTIIELIVVIGVVSILMVMLVPAVQRARVEAKKANCAVNMRAWGHSVLQYAVSNEGALPVLAGPNEPFYAASPGIKSFFSTNKLNPKVAYSPSSKVVITGEWLNREWSTTQVTWLDPIDNTDETQSPNVAAHTATQDEEAPGFTQVAGNWLTYSGSGINGTQARYSDTADAKASWTITIPAGYGTLQLEMLLRKGQEGHKNCQVEVVGRDSDVGNPQLSSTINLAAYPEAFEWVNVGNFHFYGGSRTISIKSIGAGGPISGTPTEIIIDNLAGAPQVVNTSFYSVSYSPRWGSDCYYDQNLSKGSRSVKYTPTIPIAGYYNIYVYRPGGASYANNVPVTIVHKNGTANVTDNQQLSGGTWKLLGKYEFNAGSTGYVLISNTGTTQTVLADAVKFSQVLPGESRLWADAIRLSGQYAFSGEEPDTEGWHVLDGIWALDTTDSHIGSNYLTITKDGMPKRATWIFPINESAQYDVYAFWPPTSDNTEKAKFTIYGATQSVSTTLKQNDITLDDPANAYHWRKLGTVQFNMGVNGKVEIYASDNDGKILVADAIRLAKRGLANTVSIDMTSYLYLGFRNPIAGAFVDPTVVLPNNMQELANPGSVPLIIDMYCPDGPDWATTHQDGVHVYYLDNRVEWIEGSKTNPRWCDTYYNVFRW